MKPEGSYRVHKVVHWSLPWARSIQPISPHPTCLRSIVILSTHYVLLFLMVYFLLAFSPISNMYSVSLLSCYIPYLILPDLIIPLLLDEEYKLWSVLLCSGLQPPVTSSFFGPNVLFSILFSNTNLRFSLHIRDQVSHRYRTTSKVILLYISIFTFSDLSFRKKLIS
jgi:hypothetical protein